MKSIRHRLTTLVLCVASIFLLSPAANGVTLEEIRQRGTLLHLAVPYAKFANNNAEGLDCALIKRFAKHLGVSYQLVPTDWPYAISDLTGHDPNDTSSLPSQVKGDLLACGFTMLDYRRQYVLFSPPTFTAQVWLIATRKSDTRPITPTGDLQQDIKKTHAKIKGKTVVGISNTCIDVTLFPELLIAGANTCNLAAGALTTPYRLISSEYDFMLIESTNALFVLSSWPFDFKIIGPVSPPKPLGVAFAPDSTELHKEFSSFFKQLWKSGKYEQLANNYYHTQVSAMKTFFSKSEP